MFFSLSLSLLSLRLYRSIVAVVIVVAISFAQSDFQYKLAFNKDGLVCKFGSICTWLGPKICIQMRWCENTVTAEKKIVKFIALYIRTLRVCELYFVLLAFHPTFLRMMGFVCGNRHAKTEHNKILQPVSNISNTSSNTKWLTFVFFVLSRPATRITRVSSTAMHFRYSIEWRRGARKFTTEKKRMTMA